MSRAIEAGAAVEAKRAKGLRERWHSATFVRYDLRTPIVRFKGEREETAAFKVREPKAKAPRVPRKPAPPLVRTDADVAALLPPTWGQVRPLPPEAEDFAIFAPSARPRAVEKPSKAERSEVFKDWCRRGVCCNCGAPAPSDPHHEDTTIALLRRGVGTKCRDTLCVSLCRRCHDALDLPGGGYRLPAPDGGEHTRAESLSILHDAQEERLTRALALLPQEWRIEVMSRALAGVPEAVLRAALLGERADDTTTTGATT